jgi:tetratricopeptide (TPR) repeat protein
MESQAAEMEAVWQRLSEDPRMVKSLKKFAGLRMDSDDHWHGTVIRASDFLPEYSRYFDEMGQGPSFALWVSESTGEIHPEMDLVSSPVELLVSGLLEFIKRNRMRTRPGTLHISPQDVAEQLRELIAPTGTEVVYDPDSPLLHALREKLAEDLMPQLQSLEDPLSIASAGCSEALLREFSTAASDFYRSRIWRFFGDADLLHVEAPKAPKKLSYLTVLGSGREQYGLGLYTKAETHWQLCAQNIPLHNATLASFTYDSIHEADPIDKQLWEEFQLPLETADAFPNYLHLVRGKATQPQEKDIEYLTVVLSALAQSNEEEIDSGRWEKSIRIGNKNVTCRLAIPDLLSPPSRQQWMERGRMPDPRENERFFQLVQKEFASNIDMDPSDLNQLINEKFVGRQLDTFDFPSSTPQDRADNLYYEAVANFGRRRIQLARQAIAIDPNHMNAMLLLSESTWDIAERIRLLEGLITSWSAQNMELFRADIGQFWLVSETRPYMRALEELAATYDCNGQRNEAIAVYHEMLRLNENDNLGARYLIIPLLLNQNREAEAIKVLERYSEQTASWLYSSALIAYRQYGGHSPFTKRKLRDALKFNDQVVEFLDPETPPYMPEHYGLGSREEAAVVVEEQREAWSETVGFIPFLLEQADEYARERSETRNRNRRKLPTKAKPQPKKR